MTKVELCGAPTYIGIVMPPLGTTMVRWPASCKMPSVLVTRVTNIHRNLENSVAWEKVLDGTRH